MISLKKNSNPNTPCVFELPASKSISNRALILQAFFPQLTINGLSEANDTKVLQKNLHKISVASNETIIIDVEDAGTAFRFLLGYCSIRPGDYILKGTSRLHERPIAPLVEALQALGAEIDYIDQPGYAPLRIKGKPIKGGKIQLDASVSSQFVTALLMIGTFMEEGLVVVLQNKIVSDSYIDMTVKLMEQLGLMVIHQGSLYAVPPAQEVGKMLLNIERDWSSASYAYACMAGMKQGEIFLPRISLPSLQGDAIIAAWATLFGIETKTTEQGIVLSYHQKEMQQSLHFDCLSHPDLVPTMLTISALMNVEASFSGLDTLILKETNRIEALQQEWKKFGYSFEQHSNGYYFKKLMDTPEREICVTCYADHRMAMSFAPMAFVQEIQIESKSVVQKSFPSFWEQLIPLGIQISNI